MFTLMVVSGVVIGLSWLSVHGRQGGLVRPHLPGLQRQLFAHIVQLGLGLDTVGMKGGLGVEKRLEHGRVEFDAILVEDGQCQAKGLVEVFVDVLLVFELDFELGQLGELVGGGVAGGGVVGGGGGRCRGRGARRRVLHGRVHALAELFAGLVLGALQSVSGTVEVEQSVVPFFDFFLVLGKLVELGGLGVVRLKVVHVGVKAVVAGAVRFAHALHYLFLGATKVLDQLGLDRRHHAMVEAAVSACLLLT
ncbi:hypothetical protein BpHYR1_033360 [Brachionus plicatilis]|uniref:Secreted protein n=1 Tax=Brachionus plicatilis TaxID=10195 RepID=A0A3M7PI28_BRAPC|nr:hypothetical protein BpHYR1_033360 [Brachionus plicatilis]